MNTHKQRSSITRALNFRARLQVQKMAMPLNSLQAGSHHLHKTCKGAGPCMDAASNQTTLLQPLPLLGPNHVALPKPKTLPRQPFFPGRRLEGSECALCTISMNLAC